MKLIVHPMVLAGALGLLGPAALTDNDPSPEEGLAGCWSRSTPGAGSPLLGDTIEVIPIEDRLLIDSGLDLSSDTTLWSQEDTHHIRQELLLDGARVTRDFTASGLDLAVHTVVETNGTRTVYTDHYTRES